MKKSPEWNEENIGAPEDRTFGNGLLAVFPALYGWQVYGWGVGLAVYVVVLVILAGVSWAVVFGQIKPSHAVWYRGIILVVAFAVIGVSAIEVGRP